MALAKPAVTGSNSSRQINYDEDSETPRMCARIIEKQRDISTVVWPLFHERHRRNLPTERNDITNSPLFSVRFTIWKLSSSILLFVYLTLDL